MYFHLPWHNWHGQNGVNTGNINIAIFVKNMFAVSVLHSVLLPKEFEFLALNVSLNHNNKVMVIGAYHPPSAHTKALIKLVNLISEYGDSEMLLMGDLNLDWLSSG